MSVDLDQFKGIFFEESFENLEAMESGLLELSEGEVDLETVNTIFRGAHSIKGGGAAFGYVLVSSFTHVMEELLDQMRNGKREADTISVNILLESVDVIKGMLEAYQEDEEPDEERALKLKTQLEEIRDSADGAPPAAPEAAEAVEADSGEREEELIGWEISFIPHDDLLQTGNDPSFLIRELAELGEMTLETDVSRVPVFALFNPEHCYVSWQIKLDGAVEKEQISEIFEWVEDECDLEIKPVYKEVERRADDRRSDERRTDDRRSADKSVDRRQSSRRGGGKQKAAPAATIRVSTERIDEIIDMVGELVITQSMLSQLGEDLNLTGLDRLREGLEQLERNSRELQEGIMGIRMQPISFAFNRFPRMVHDVSQKLGKQIRLETKGEETEMDKTVMEKINDPLVHLVRNSIDHGLELPEERIAAGKPEEGVVSLTAYHQGGSIVVEISDDGRGLNRDKIAGKAVERGLITEPDLLSDEQVFRLLFEPGFSTADVVSDLSGRGVGLDVVRRNIESLGGSVDISSRLGEGSTFTIRLPLTLAVLDGQLMRIDSQVFVLPLSSIVESLQMRPEFISAVGAKTELYSLRDEYIPIVRFSDAFNIGEHRENLESALLVVVEWGNKHIGLLVDELLGQQQVVIKSLETNFKRVPGISGATILGDGTVSLILDISGVMEMSGMNNAPGVMNRASKKESRAV